MDSRLVVVSADEMKQGGWAEDSYESDLPKMSEGSVIIGDKLDTSYESGSSQYGLPVFDKAWDVVGVIERRDRLTVHSLG